jgi:hypothetical protein
MMKPYVMLSLIALCLVIGGCARKLPDRQPGYGMVAVPFKFNNTSGFPILYTYELRSSEDESFSIVIEPQFYKDDVVVSGLLAEGEYLVDTVVTRSVKKVGVYGGATEETSTISDPDIITVNDGEIGVFPMLMAAKQSIMGEYIRIDFEYIPFNDKLAEFYLGRAKQRENSDQWKVGILQFRKS